MPSDALTRLRERLGEVADLQAAARLLDWDEQTMMPPGGAQARAHQLATLERVAHQRFVSDDLGALLEELAGDLDLDANDDDASLVRVTIRRYRKARQVPAELKGEIAYRAALGQRTWETARAADDLAAALPVLQRNVELAREYAACFPDRDPYDSLLDDYEEGMQGDDVGVDFEALKGELVDLAGEVAQRREALGAPAIGPFDVARQKRFVRDLLARVGLDEAHWRMDEAAHPFLAPIDRTDLRLTTRYNPVTLDGALAALHEFGHGLYAHGVGATLSRTPLGTSASMGLDESQSRLWENVIGRSRAFSSFLCPLVREHFGTAVDGLSPEGLYRALNVVEPTLIRVSADEVHYSLHVILRFEIERDLISGELAVADLAERWRSLVADYLGAEVTSDATGALQDVHWWVGAFGYFPTYALGNVMALQVWERLQRDLPQVTEDIAAGRFEALRAWLAEQIYSQGAKLMSGQVLERLTGNGLDPVPYVRYLQAKFGDLYGLGTRASSAHA
ncbi:MAG: carboxypeptidase M32 [Gemmatimonadota bacterium]|nr:carboxypeptidase M32 [Gemmatimonadota bacterium]